MEKNPFANAFLNWLFERDKVDSSTLSRYENTEIEYKESFSYEGFKDYIKTIVGFSNNHGGYLIFGIKDQPRKIVGMSSNRFQKLNQRKINQFFNNYLSAEIKWDCYLHKIEDKHCGIIYIAEGNQKPIIIKKNGANIKEGQIYYRYAGETKLIKTPELQNIINNRILEEREKWQNLISKLARLSPDQVSVLNLKQGIIEENDTNLILDEDTISKINFIKEGNFKEKEGSPTLKIKGEVKDFSGKEIIVNKEKPTTIHRNDIYKVFFTENCNHPKEYLKQMAYESSYYLPIWFFINSIKKSKEYIIDLFNNLNDANDFIKGKLIERLDSDNPQIFKIDYIYDDLCYNSNWSIDKWEEIKSEYKKENNSQGTKKVDRTIALEFMINEPTVLLPIDENFKKYFNEIINATTHIPYEDLINNKSAINNIVNGIRKQLEKDDTNMRKSICYLDYMYYGKNIIEG